MPSPAQARSLVSGPARPSTKSTRGHTVGSERALIRRLKLPVDSRMLCPMLDQTTKCWIERWAQDVLGQVKASHRQSPLVATGSAFNPVDLLDPLVVAKVLGLEYREEPDLGQFGMKGDRFVVGGALNRPGHQVCVLDSLAPPVARFTAAHEFGHFVLHPDEQMHRDIQIDCHAQVKHRSPKEQEADYFAACLLMPAAFVKIEFTHIFGNQLPLRIDENLAFHLKLNPHDPDFLLRPTRDRLERERALSIVTTLGGVRFESLAERFRVSTTAMAIRISELRLVAD